MAAAAASIPGGGPGQSATGQGVNSNPAGMGQRSVDAVRTFLGTLKTWTTTTLSTLWRFITWMGDGILAFFKKLKTSTTTILAKLWEFVARTAFTLWWGSADEVPKIVIHKPSIWRVLRKCLIHVLPILAAVFLAILNLNTYFLGSQFTGRVSAGWQDFDKWGLQIAAKGYEILTIASLTTILMDVLREQLLRSADGLPLGILTAKTLFADITYLFSPDFRHGITGVKSKRTGFLLFLLVGACTGLALLVGPSSALLMIPNTFTDWPGGGATFFVSGQNETLWPLTLTGAFDHIGGSHCQSPSGDLLTRQQLNMSSCIWTGYAAMKERFKNIHTVNQVLTAAVSLQDGLIERTMGIHFFGDGAAVLGVHIATCVYSDILANMWWWCLKHASITQSGSLSKYSGLRSRERDSTVSSVTGQVPCVLTACNTLSNVSFPDQANSQMTLYPQQPLYPTAYQRQVTLKHHSNPGVIVLPYAEVDFEPNATKYVSSPQIAALWLETPWNEVVGAWFDADDNVYGRSSAYLNVQIPTLNETFGTLISCSIDARWVNTTTQGAPVGVTSGGPSYESVWPYETTDPTNLPAVPDGNWHVVRLTLEWLNALTPTITSKLANGTVVNGTIEDGIVVPNPPGWNTLADILTGVGIDNHTGLLGNWETANLYVGSVVSSVVADGMSRIGFEANGGNLNSTLYPTGGTDKDLTRVADFLARNLYRGNTTDYAFPKSGQEMIDAGNPVIQGTYTLPFLYSDSINTTNKFQFRWDVTVVGMGYKMVSTANYLALVVLFIHVFLALGHSIWAIYTRETSSAWNSVTEIITLALISHAPSQGFQNVAAGIEEYKTLQTPVRVRVLDSQGSSAGSSVSQGNNPPAPSHNLEMVVGDNHPTHYKDVVTDEKY